MKKQIEIKKYGVEIILESSKDHYYYFQDEKGKETKAPSLSKVGKEFIQESYGITEVIVSQTTVASDGYVIVTVVKNWIRQGSIVASGVGAQSLPLASSNPTDINTAIKMASKSSGVDCAITFLAISHLFTQDLENIKGFKKVTDIVESIPVTETKSKKSTKEIIKEIVGPEIKVEEMTNETTKFNKSVLTKIEVNTEKLEPVNVIASTAEIKPINVHGKMLNEMFGTNAQAPSVQVIPETTVENADNSIKEFLFAAFHKVDCTPEQKIIQNLLRKEENAIIKKELNAFIKVLTVKENTTLEKLSAKGYVEIYKELERIGIINNEKN